MSLTDLHNHLLPGVDDGASSLEESRAGLHAMAAAGVTAIVSTPHVYGSDTTRPEALQRRLAELDAGWQQLTALASVEFPGVELHRGAECMLDVPEPDLSDPRLRLAGGIHVLVEFPFMEVPPNSDQALRALVTGGLRPVLAHPERYTGLDERLHLPEHWRDAGALLQVNGGSLVGRYGAGVQARSWELLQRGWVSCVCSDYHSRGDPLILRYRKALENAAGEETVALLLEINPRRILAGEQPLPVPAMPGRQPVWSRLASTLRRVIPARVR